MSQLELNQFQAHLSKIVDGRSTSDIVKDARKLLSREISSLESKLIDLGLAKCIQRIRSRKATVSLSNGRDLFVDFNLPTTSKLAKTDSDSKNKTKRTENLTKSEVRNKRNELAQLPRRQQKLLKEYSRLYEKIDPHCTDEEIVQVGLERSIAQ